MILLSDGRVVTPEQFKAENRNVIYSSLYPSTGYLVSIGAKRVLVDPKPEITELQVLMAGEIVMRDGTPYQTWTVRDKTPQEIEQEQKEIQTANKSQAEQLLKETDWVEIPSVSDTANNPHLVNYAEFIVYRLALRAIAVNPPTEPAVFPDLPQEQWSTV